MFNMIKKYANIIIVALIVLFAFMIRLYQLAKPSGLWLDEISSYFTTLYPIFDLNRHSIHAPFYFILLKIWINIFGSSDFVLRLLSVILSLPAVVGIYLCGKELDLKKISPLAIFSALILATSSLFFYYSQEIRFYSFAVSIVSFITLYCIKTVKEPNRKNLTFLILFNFLFIISYTSSIVYVFIELVFLCVYLYKNKKEVFKNTNLGQVLLIVFLCSLILYSPVINKNLHRVISPYGLKASISGLPFYTSSIFLIFKNLSTPILDGLYNNIPQYLNYFCHTYLNKQNLLSTIFFILIPMTSYLIGILRSFYKPEKLSKLLIFLLGIVITYSLIHLLLFTLITRYVLIILPVLVMITVNGLLKIKYFGRIICVYLVLINLIYVFAVPDNKVLNDRQTGMQTVMNLINNNVKIEDNDYILAPHYAEAAWISYYYEDKNKISDKYPITFIKDEDKFAREIYNTLNKSNNFIILCYSKNYIMKNDSYKKLKRKENRLIEISDKIFLNKKNFITDSWSLNVYTK